MPFDYLSKIPFFSPTFSSSSKARCFYLSTSFFIIFQLALGTNLLRPLILSLAYVAKFNSNSPCWASRKENFLRNCGITILVELRHLIQSFQNHVSVQFSSPKRWIWLPLWLSSYFSLFSLTLFSKLSRRMFLSNSLWPFLFCSRN